MNPKRDVGRVLIYKRTHEGDPDPKMGVFGNKKCMKRVRSWDFDAVIGVGGLRPWPKYTSIACKLTWIGIGAHKDEIGKDGYHLVTFDQFWYQGENGPLLEKRAPMLARRLFRKKARVLLVTSASAQWREVKKILSLATKARSSAKLRSAPQRNNSEPISGECRQTLVVEKPSANTKESCS